jgi:hypothetical protein
MECLFSEQHQLLRRWRTDISPKASIITFFVVGVLLLIYGFAIHLSMSDLQILSERYDNLPVNSSEPFMLNITIPKPMAGTVVFLYKLVGFYQNHRRMYSSKSYPQLAGEHATNSQLSSCSPLIYKDGNEVEANLFIPCGSLAVSFFDEFFVVNNFSEAGIAPGPDRDDLFRPISDEYRTGIRHLLNKTDFPGETVNEHFIVWMRAAAFPVFMKPFAFCRPCHIPAGTFSVVVKKNYPTSEFAGERWAVLAEVKGFGSGSARVEAVAIGVGGAAVALGIGFLLLFVCCPNPGHRFPGMRITNASTEFDIGLFDNETTDEAT